MAIQVCTIKNNTPPLYNILDHKINKEQVCGNFDPVIMMDSMQ